MRTTFCLTLSLLVCILLASSTLSHARGGSSTYVRGYTTKTGKYVAPHHRSSPDGSRMNNWSTKGNVNPYTGKPGSADPYKPRK